MPVCKCGESAPGNFYYHSRAKRYYEDCKQCWNQIRRDEYDRKRQDRMSSPTQVCVTCKQPRPTPEFLMQNGKSLRRVCAPCRDNGLLTLGPLEDIERELFPYTPAEQLTREQRERAIELCKLRLGIPA